MRDAILAHDGFVSERAQGTELHVPNRAALRELFGGRERLLARFELPVADGVLYVSRTHPMVTGLAGHVLDTALDPLADGVAWRCGVTRTRAVPRATTLLLLRYRFHIVTRRWSETVPLLAEACDLMGFQGHPARAHWLAAEQAEALLAATPDANVPTQQARELLQRVLDGMRAILPELDERARRRGAELLDAHRRVRTAARLSTQVSVEPQLSADVLGVYLLLSVV